MGWCISLKDSRGEPIDFSNIGGTNNGFPNTTYNIGEMYSKLPCGDISDWDGLKVEAMIRPVADSLVELIVNKDKYIKYNSKNGWGTTESAAEFLRNCLNAFLFYPDAKIVVG